MPATIRLLQPTDAKDLAANCFPEIPLEDIEERVHDDLLLQERGEGFTLVAEEDGRVGATAKLLSSGKAGWIFNVAAHGDFRGRGIMQDLLARAAEMSKVMGLERLAIHVRADNPRARRAYEKAGFKWAGQDGMDGEQLRYEKKL